MSVHLRVHDVSLELPLDMQRPTEFANVGMKSALGGSVRRYATVLSAINFAAQEGDRIALMGLNGAGKTTLLRVLNGAFQPTRGRVDSRGRVQSLLSSMIGFADQASLVENIFLRGTAMGLRRRQLQSVLGDVLDFAGLRDRANHRLHTLSAGQRTRLGFAISTAVQPDILLMDEWLTTGDAVFIKRAEERMLGRFQDSRIVVLASHGVELQRRLCNKALVLDGGKMRHFGGIEQGLSIYRDIVSSAGAKMREQAAASDPLLFGDVSGFVERIRLCDGAIEVEGWAIGDRGREVAVLCVELDGADQMVERFDRIERDDVLRATAKRSGRFGFRFSIQPGPIDPEGLAVRLRVSAGSSRTRLGPPLNVLTGAVVAADVA